MTCIHVQYDPLTIESPRGQMPTKLLKDYDYTDFIGSDYGPIPAAKLRQLASAHYLGYKGWLIKLNLLNILQKIEIMFPPKGWSSAYHKTCQ